jgi:hypothetical protein
MPCIAWRRMPHIPLMITFWKSEDAIRALAEDGISRAKYSDVDKDLQIELEPCSVHYKMYDKLTLPLCARG